MIPTQFYLEPCGTHSPSVHSLIFNKFMFKFPFKMMNLSNSLRYIKVTDFYSLYVTVLIYNQTIAKKCW